MTEQYFGTFKISAKDAVYNAFREHNSQPRSSTELTMLDFIRKSHPHHNVVCTGPATADLLGYAAAGHAILIRDTDTFYDASRNYVPPKVRLETKTGELRDHVRFARFKYFLDSVEYLVYQAEYIEPPGYRGPTKLFYILYPKESDIENKGLASKKGTAIDNLLVTVGIWTSTPHNEIYVFDDGRWTKDKTLYTSVQSASWDDVILAPTTKSTLINDVQSFFDNKALYHQLSVPWKRGLILHGVPGNGKTISIKALIRALSERAEPVPSLYVKSFDAYQGQKYAIRSIFSQARTLAPCLLIFEDLDSLVTDKTRSYFLNEVDGLESNEGILMIGSTNHLSSLDPAISKRPSRFDRKYHFKLPDLEERMLYCEFWRKKLLNTNHTNTNNPPIVDFDQDLCRVIAELSDGFSFAYMKELFIIALLTIARGSHADATEGDNEKASQAGTGSRSPTDTDPVMVEHETPPPTAAAAPTPTPVNAPAADPTPLLGACCQAPVAAAGKAAPAPKKKTRVLPAVEVPEHLKENLLLKVIQSQLKILFEEMDNTSEDEWLTSKAPKSSGGGGGPVWPFMGNLGLDGAGKVDEGDCC